MGVTLLDLYCGAGGAAEGYSRAGFHVVGVDIVPQPRYPFEFVRGDALEFVAEFGREFDVVHASPPCQHYANVTRWRRNGWDGDTNRHPALIEPTRAALDALETPYVIENVRTPALRHPVMLCGSMFGLNVRRHRYFEICPRLPLLTPPCAHNGQLAFEHKQERAYANAMGCGWMTNREARQAIPPAYTEWIGRRLLEYLEVPEWA